MKLFLNFVPLFIIFINVKPNFFWIKKENFNSSTKEHSAKQREHATYKTFWRMLHKTSIHERKTVDITVNNGSYKLQGLKTRSIWNFKYFKHHLRHACKFSSAMANIYPLSNVTTAVNTEQCFISQRWL